MDDNIYSSTTFWQLLGGINDFSGWFMPFFMFFATFAWIWREGSILSCIALLGGILAACARVTHWLVPSVNSITLGYPEPIIEQNTFIWFFYIQAFNIGSFIFVVCVGCRFIFKHTHN